MYSTLLHEPQFLAFAYDLEQEMQARRQPQFLLAHGKASASRLEPPVLKSHSNLCSHKEKLC